MICFELILCFNRVLNYERILLTLSQCELSMNKSEQTLRMISQEMNNYENLYEKIDKSITECQQKLIKCKEELIEAKRIRKNKCEYEAMAEVIDKHSDRCESLARLQDLEEEIKRLQQTKDEMQNKLEKRRKQFHVLLGAAHQLNQILNGLSYFSSVSALIKLISFLQKSPIIMK